MDTKTVEISHLECPWSEEQIDQWREELQNILMPEAFITWINSHDKDAVIGYANRTCGCPIYEYLKAKLPYLDCRVGESAVYTTLPPGWLHDQCREIYYLTSYKEAVGHLPPWIKSFVLEIDNLCMRSTPAYRNWMNNDLSMQGINLYEYPFEVKPADALYVMNKILSSPSLSL